MSKVEITKEHFELLIITNCNQLKIEESFKDLKGDKGRPCEKVVYKLKDKPFISTESISKNGKPFSGLNCNNSNDKFYRHLRD
jgi:hypothetical protein